MSKEFVSTHEKIFGHNHDDRFSRDRGENLSSWLALYFFSCDMRNPIPVIPDVHCDNDSNKFKSPNFGDYLQFHKIVELNTTASVNYSVPVIPGAH